MTAPLRLDVRRRAAGGEPATELLLDVPSHLEYVGPAVELIADQFRAPLPLSGSPGRPVAPGLRLLSPRRVRFNLRTALAEALANAIAYGNRQDPSRVVRVRVEVTVGAVHVHVTDEGAGFDPTAVPDPTLPERLEREDGRGLYVLRSLVDHVAFNEKGNSVCLTLLAG
ncbi:MAG TPA: ATP-binding protein [Gemmatimonadales bacterium]|nr:ATP-binding protein [Gemmatimonadales bacterium]